MPLPASVHNDPAQAGKAPAGRSAMVWFAGAAAALTITAAVGAYGTAWLTRAEQGTRSAFMPLARPAAQARFEEGVDRTATGSIPSKR